MAQGEEAWTSYPDPFPEWQLLNDEDEEAADSSETESVVESI